MCFCVFGFSLFCTQNVAMINVSVCLAKYKRHLLWLNDIIRKNAFDNIVGLLPTDDKLMNMLFVNIFREKEKEEANIELMKAT